MLLSDPSIEALLRDELVPCWESLHPTAKLEVTFADGKRLERTLGGNTVVSICTADGAIVDAFPGIYTPSDFLAEAEVALRFVRSARKLDIPALLDLHGAYANLKINAELITSSVTTVSKGVLESPPRLAMTPPILWSPTANVPLDISKHGASIEDIRRLVAPNASTQDAQALGRTFVAADSMRNRSVTRPLVRRLLAQQVTLADPAATQRTIFEQVLGTSLSDPYFGLADAVIPGTQALPR